MLSSPREPVTAMGAAGERSAALLLQGRGSKGSGQFSQQLERLSLFEGKKNICAGILIQTMGWDPGRWQVIPKELG